MVPVARMQGEPAQLIARGRDLGGANDYDFQQATGALESSNVNAASAMVNMIELARQFDLQMKSIRTAEDDARSSASLLRMG